MTEIPQGVTRIGGYAFYSCYKIKELVIPEGVTELGGGAFYHCSGTFTVPASVTEIGYETFRKNDDIIVHCKKGSFAETYMKENGITYVAE